MSEIYGKQDTETENTLEGKFLTFFLENEVFGIDIQYVTEIISLVPINEVPDVAEYVKGIINLRGKIIPVIDVRLKFHKPEVKYDDKTCIIVVNIEGESAGFIVDSVDEVIQIDETNISAPPVTKGASNAYLKGIGKVGSSIKLLLDCRQMLSEDIAA